MISDTPAPRGRNDDELSWVDELVKWGFTRYEIYRAVAPSTGVNIELPVPRPQNRKSSTYVFTRDRNNNGK